MCLFAWFSLAPTGRIFVKFDIRDWCEKSAKKIYISLKSGILCEDLQFFIVDSNINSILSRRTVIGCFDCRKGITTANTKWSYCCVSVITMVTQTRHFITLCVHCPPFLSLTIGHTARLWKVKHSIRQCLSFGDIEWTAEACSATRTPRATGDGRRKVFLLWLDFARPHSAVWTVATLRQLQYEVFVYSPYVADLVPSECNLLISQTLQEVTSLPVSTKWRNYCMHGLSLGQKRFAFSGFTEASSPLE